VNTVIQHSESFGVQNVIQLKTKKACGRFPEIADTGSIFLVNTPEGITKAKQDI
jgi:hypothetical protein